MLDSFVPNSLSSDMRDIDLCVADYKTQLEKSSIRKAYGYLLRYVMHLKAHFANELSDRYSFGNVSPGYMDFTYFPFFDDFLRERKLRLGVVLNHQDLRFELWLMGQNAAVQKRYWSLLRKSAWNAGRTEMPKYSVVEAILAESPRFEDAGQLTVRIKEEAMRISEAVADAIRVAEAREASSGSSV
ncbi:hypothetical protein I5U23_16635 [Stenotrophomonas maltophilia]|uniref:DUF7000 domain-containing protein n=1 Tax=Stenotrophomonas riyadhensis TaxID=2859893 RepID=A0ABT2XB54_9GAMM|nr:hypothetical protein [Stenotrophomonas sp. CFS3442]MBH1619548.1 hypothetical protein [Stenotrophomonas maltophilia]MCV0323164.1 hypothetical protein [Stenotrophomonas sp. CFS3442]HEL4242975.1 hypothetical protein [Stenotrophomonas maltophilia]